MIAYRADEVVRQRAHRAKERASPLVGEPSPPAPSGPRCHAPASAPKLRISKVEIDEIVAAAERVSRTTLAAQTRALVHEISRRMSVGVAAAGP